MAKTNSTTRKIVLLALFIAQALVLSIVESWIPVPAVVPGLKLGLANIITIVVIIFFNFESAFVVMALRTFLASLFTGGPVTLIYSAAGGILSTLVMSLLYYRYRKYFSITGISIAGAVFHNIGQLIAASIVMHDLAVISYLPLLLGAGIITGFFIGACGSFLEKALRRAKLF
jgi:heptaprenyl diphosphate synthase